MGKIVIFLLVDQNRNFLKVKESQMSLNLYFKTMK